MESYEIDFTWIYFVGTTLLHFTQKEVGHFTFRKWNNLFEYYKRFYNFKLSGQKFDTEPMNEDEVYESYEWFSD